MTTVPRDTRIRIEVVRLRVPLVRPYKLAFGPVTAFDALVVLMHDDTGRRGAGEATLLTGYTDETIEGAWDGARALATALAGASAREVARKVLAVAPSSPFLATAFMTALDALHAHPLLTVDAPSRVPILGILNETDDGALEAEIEKVGQNGYAFDNEEFLPGLFCIAVLVPSPEGRSNMGIAMQAPIMRMTEQKALESLPALRRAAAALAAIEAENASPSESACA